MIRKYRNRRLYDTEKSKNGGYTTLADVRERVLKGEEVQSHGAYQRTATQVTTEVLLGIVLADYAKGTGPTPDDLRRFIESYSHSR